MMLCWKCAIRVKTTWPVNHFMHYEQGTSLVIRPEFGTNTILTSTINRAAEIWGGHVMVMGGTEVEGQRANIVDDTRSFTPESEQTWRADPWKPAPKGSWEPGPSDPAADFAAGLEMVRRQTDEFCKRKFVRRPSTDKHHLAPSWQLRKGLR